MSMKMNAEDRQMLIKHGVPEQDFDQMVRASNVTVYKLNTGVKSETIKLHEVIDYIGRSAYWLAIARSAFHYTTTYIIDDKAYISFDSSKLFNR